MNLTAHLHRQRYFSLEAFGPGPRTKGISEHIRKELLQVADAVESGQPTLPECVDVVILALDGAHRSGAAPEEIVAAIEAKQTKNEGRNWPDWRKADPDKAIEHVRS